MTNDMMTLQALLAKQPDTDIVREMRGFGVCRPPADGPGGREQDRRRPRRAHPERLTHRNGPADKSLINPRLSAPSPVLGRDQRSTSSVLTR